MSEQNSMAISPVTAGLAGAAIGGIGNYVIGVGAKPEKGYKDVKELLTLENDKFEALKKKIEDSDNADAKAEFKKLEDGRVTVSKAGDTLVKEQADARRDMTAAIEDAVKNKKITAGADAEKKALDEATDKVEDLRKKMGGLEIEKDASGNITGVKHDAGENAEVKAKREDLRKARKTAREAIVNEKTKGLGKELEEARNAAAGKTGDELTAAQKKIDEVEVKIAKEVTENADVKKAKEALNVERKKVMTEDALKPFKERNELRQKYSEKLVASADDALKDVKADDKAADGTLEKLKSQIEGWKKKLTESVDDLKKTKAEELVGEKGALKDLDTGKFKKFLPKAKMIPALIGAAVLGAAGVALAYIVGPKNETPADVA